ncbi:MAG TPA: acyloxyacyl hydrolase [Methylothermaceae bacterium]|nr:acyloxyacyl hydrolase [Methylothermaceae bacterium]
MGRIWQTIVLLAVLAGSTQAEEPFWRPGTFYLGGQAGWGEGFSLGFSGNGDPRLVEYVAVLPHLGFDISGWVGQDRWYRGNLDILVEAEYFEFRQPKRGHSVGGAALLRYNFRPWPRLSPYVDAGFGLGDLDVGLRDQADGLVFYPQFGIGVNWSVTRRLSLNAGWRYHHMSNAGRELPNNGINANVFLLGFDLRLN